jgi:FtsH-binding integral membrane protein
MERDTSFGIGLSKAEISERTFLSQVYLWMALGLLLTGFVAGWIAFTPVLAVGLMKHIGLFFILMLVQLGLVFWLSSQILNLSVTTATIGFSIYATLNGVLFSTIFLVYTGASIASTFVVTAGMFGAISLYGFTTKKDLSSVGSFCFMALIGLILASIVDWFFRSPFLYWVITYAGIAIFIGLTAWDTQALKQIHQQGFSSESAMKKIALLGALKLYLDFINLFLLLLRILGSRRR